MNLPVYNLEKKKTGEIQVNEKIFSEPVHMDIIHSVVRWQLACRRQGTHSTRTKGLVSGGGKKPFKQKGTGNARQGSTRSPLNPGGGTMFGPQPRDYSYVLPKKVRQLGLRMALSYLHKEGRLFVVDKMEASGKTKDMNGKLSSFGLSKAVLIDVEAQEKVSRAIRNLPNYKYYSTMGLNVFDLLKFDTVLIAKSALNGVEARCGMES